MFHIFCIKMSINWKFFTFLYLLYLKTCYVSEINTWETWATVTMESHSSSRRYKHQVLYCHVNTNNIQSQPCTLLHFTHLPQDPDNLADIIRQQSERNISITFQTELKCSSAEPAHHGTVHSWGEAKKFIIEKGRGSFKEFLELLRHCGTAVA